MNRRKYLIFLIVFVSIFSMISGVSYATPCGFYDAEITTTGLDTNIDATSIENFSIGSDVWWSGITNWKFNITTNVPQKHIISSNLLTIDCSVSDIDKATYNAEYIIYDINDDVLKIICEYNIISLYGDIYTYINFTTNTTSVENDIITPWVMSYHLKNAESDCVKTGIYSEPETTILAPSLEIESIQKYSDGWQDAPFYVYINTDFILGITAKNINLENFNTGSAFGVYSNITYNETAFTNQSGCNPHNLPYGDITSGDVSDAFCNFTANILGNYTFNTILSDWTGNYTSNNYTDINVVNLTVSGYAEPPQYYGNNTTIYAIVNGNASEIENVNAIWNYTYLNASNEIDIGTSNCTMDLFEVINTTIHKYKCERQFLDSGNYNITFNVTDIYGTDTITATNTTILDLPFGFINDANVWFNDNEASPIILKNQTFNITIEFFVSQGDIWDLNVTLNTSNNQTINITSNPFLSLGNLKNGTRINATWTVYANNTDIVQLTITANHTTGADTIDEYVRVVDVISAVQNSTLNITEEQNITLKIAGNLSELINAKLKISKEYGGFEFTPDEESYTEVPLDECYSLSEDSQNIATLSHGASANYSGGIGSNNEPNSTIDEDNTTSWSGFSGTNNPVEINITFNRTYSLKNLELLWHDNNKESNISIYYMDYPSGMDRGWGGGATEKPTKIWKLLTTNIDAPDTKNITLISQTFITDKIKIVQNSNLTPLYIYSFNATTVTQDSKNQSCYLFNFLYDNTTRSGDYNVSFNVTLNKSLANSVNANDFFINYGYPIIDSITTHLIGQQNYTPTITAKNGDLRNINLNISFSNLTIFNLSVGETISKNIDYILSGTSKNTTWDLNSSESGTVNVTIIINSTSNQGDFLNQTEKFDIVSNDTKPPIINSFWFEYNQTNKTNIMTDFIIYANITDNETYVKNATAIVYYPSGGNFSKTQITTMSEEKTDSIWKIILNSKLNETGNYTVKISAYDFLSNYNESGDITGPKNRSFNVTNIYHFALIDYNPYNRGENITTNLLDINNNTVTNANWTVNITKYLSNETIERTGIIYQNDYAYEIKTNDTVGNYTINIINATKNGNYINNTIKQFNVSKTLNIVLNTTIASSYTYSEAYNLPTIKAWLFNVRSEPIILTNLDLYYKGSNYDMDYNTPNGPYELDVDLKPSSTSGASFPLKINITDANNNTGEFITYINTTPTTPPPGGGGGGGSSSSGGSSGGMSFAPTQTQENKTPIINFDYIVENNEREFIQGYPDTVVVTIINTGELPLLIHTKTSPSQIDITIDNNFTLDVGADKSIKITFYANLSMNPDIYYADIILYNEKLNLEKTRTFKLIVNENDDISSYIDLKNQVDSLELEIFSFENLNINTSNLRKRTEKIQQYLSEAQLAIQTDELETLQVSINNARNELTDAKLLTASLKTTQFIIENKWAILSSGITTLVVLYLLLYLIMPYAKISKRIRKLTRLEKIIIDTRKATEKKYFMRQLNEMTFNKIMADEENKLIKYKSEVTKLTQEKHLLMHLKLGKIKQLESDKKNEKERVKKETDLKIKAKQKMSDIIIAHDMNKKKSILEYFGIKKKRKEFVFDNKFQKVKTDITNQEEKRSLFSKLFKHSKLKTASFNNKSPFNIDANKTNNSSETINKDLIVESKNTETNLNNDENIAVNKPPIPTKKELNNINYDFKKSETIYDKNNTSIINDESNKQKEEKTLYSTNNKDDIKEEINKIKKILRG